MKSLVPMAPEVSRLGCLSGSIGSVFSFPQDVVSAQVGGRDVKAEGAADCLGLQS